MEDLYLPSKSLELSIPQAYTVENLSIPTDHLFVGHFGVTSFSSMYMCLESGPRGRVTTFMMSTTGVAIG